MIANRALTIIHNSRLHSLGACILYTALILLYTFVVSKGIVIKSILLSTNKMIYKVFTYIFFMTLSIAISFSVNVDKIDTIDQIDKYAIITPFEQDEKSEQIHPISSSTERKRLSIKRKRFTNFSPETIQSRNNKGSDKTKGLSRFQLYRLAIKARVSSMISTYCLFSHIVLNYS